MNHFHIDLLDLTEGDVLLLLLESQENLTFFILDQQAVVSGKLRTVGKLIKTYLTDILEEALGRLLYLKVILMLFM